ncbi:hypothetical protein [Streptomyces longisporus]|uniref:Uncharacterized protein n=1 Tax=Streptomyces longisporus TaxID=1948 RepID=A0ABP6AS38_STRLO
MYGRCGHVPLRRPGRRVPAYVPEGDRRRAAEGRARIRGDEPATTAFTAHHQLTFTAHHQLTFTALPDGTWQLTRERLTEQGPGPVNEPAPATRATPVRPGAVIDAPRSAITHPAPANPKNPGTGTPYGYAAMATYAEKYWKNRLEGPLDDDHYRSSSSGVPYLTCHDTDTYRQSPASLIASY